MPNVYEYCPEFESDEFLLRFVEKDDMENLLTVYSDKHSLPFSIVIIVMVIIFTIPQKIKWNGPLIFG